MDKSHFRQCITTVAQHDSFQIFTGKIFKFWEELYSKTRSITEQQEIIDSFLRKKKEALVAALLRVAVDIDQMEYAEDLAAWNGIRDKQRRDILMKILLPETFSYLRSCREAHEKNGNSLKVDEMIQEAHTFEQSYNYVPQKDRKIIQNMLTYHRLTTVSCQFFHGTHEEIFRTNCNQWKSTLQHTKQYNASYNHLLQLLLTPNNNK